LCFLPPLVLHLHLEYAETRNLLKAVHWKRIALILMYAPVPYFALKAYALLASLEHFNILVPGSSLGRSYGVWLVVALFVSTILERRLGLSAPRRVEARFHWFAFVTLCVAAALVYEVHFNSWHYSAQGPIVAETLLALTSIFPLGLLIYLVQRHDFLQFGRQKNLVYAVTVTFLALLYLSLVRRVSTWLEPVFPPEASAAILLFVLVVFYEPLQRILARKLQETAHREMDRVQNLLVKIQHEARQGNAEQLRRFVEKWVREAFELASAEFSIRKQADERGNAPARENGKFRLSREGPPSVMFLDLKDSIACPKSGNIVGLLRVESHGPLLSGETRAALEFLCEQLPTAIELCEAVEEKAQLERELAERERLALVGQTAASISHNLKNPLGSIKTILQVQLENPEMPESMRGETKMVLDEISRLSGKLNQLLQFSRPAVRAGSGTVECDARVVIEEAVSVLRPQAEKRGTSLRVELAVTNTLVATTAEALNDIASNLLVNALEAVSSGGHVMVSGEMREKTLALFFDDDGPGIPELLREKILQPFFTTKSQGTGLGLAIVARRVAECDGAVAWKSPLRDGRGTRFEISLPRVEEVKEAL
jgi:signal transduction histidine kinase